jgi:hypothetical protein
MIKNIDPKKMKNEAFFIFTFVLLGMYSAKSQTVIYDTISKKKYVRVDVHKTYERVVEKGYESVEMFEYLGNYYYACKNFEKSKLYFDILFKKYKLSQISSKSIELYKTL